VRHTISGVVRNEVGVLARIASLFAKHDVNIKSVALSETDLLDTTRFTMVVRGNDEKVRQITSELTQSHLVVEVDDLANKECINRELALVKVEKQGDVISQLTQIAELFSARVISVGNETVTFEVTGEEERVDGFIRMMHPFGIRALSRTGQAALEPGDEV